MGRWSQSLTNTLRESKDSGMRLPVHLNFSIAYVNNLLVYFTSPQRAAQRACSLGPQGSGLTTGGLGVSFPRAQRLRMPQKLEFCGETFFLLICILTNTYIHSCSS